MFHDVTRYGENCFRASFTNRNELSQFISGHGPLTRYVKCGLRMRRECRERFPLHRLQRNPIVSMHHSMCVTHVPWNMSGSLTRGGGKNRSWHSRRMRNTQCWVSGKRPMGKTIRQHNLGNRITLTHHIICSNSTYTPMKLELEWAIHIPGSIINLS